MTDDQTGERNTEEQMRERIEEARAEAAAYVVQRQPLEAASGTDVGDVEERIARAVEDARDERDPEVLEDLADEAESGRDDIRRQLYGPGSEPSAGRD